LHTDDFGNKYIPFPYRCHNRSKPVISLKKMYILLRYAICSVDCCNCLHSKTYEGSMYTDTICFLSPRIYGEISNLPRIQLYCLSSRYEWIQVAILILYILRGQSPYINISLKESQALYYLKIKDFVFFSNSILFLNSSRIW